MAFKPLDDAPAGSVSFRPLDDTEATTPTAADYLKGAASGVGGLVSGIGYLAEAAGANQLGGSIRGIGDTTQRYWQDSMTPAGQRAAQSQVFDDDPGSALPKLGDRWGQALAMGAAQSAPSMVAAAIPGGLAAIGLRGAAGIAASRGIGGALAPLAAGTAVPIGGWATNLAGNLAARVPTALGFGAAEGAVAGASNAAQWKSDIEQKPLAELRKMPGFAALEAQIGEQAARQQIAEQGAADIMARTTLATGGIGALTGGGALGSAFQRVTTGAKGGILGAIGRDAAKEAGQELLQSGGERAVQNVATRDYLDPNQSAMQGVIADALSGAAIGGVMGGVTGGASHLAKGPLQKAVEASAATAPPAGTQNDGQGIPQGIPQEGGVPPAGIPPGTNGIPPGTIPGVHGTQQPAAGLAAAAQNTQQQSPAPGFVRYYHGGSPESVDGPLWFTSDLRDAEGWASRSPEMGIWYVDVPADHPSVAGDPVFGVLPPSRVELPKELAALRRKLQWRSEPVQNTPADASVRDLVQVKDASATSDFQSIEGEPESVRKARIGYEAAKRAVGNATYRDRESWQRFINEYKRLSGTPASQLDVTSFSNVNFPSPVSWPDFVVQENSKTNNIQVDVKYALQQLANNADVDLQRPVTYSGEFANGKTGTVTVFVPKSSHEKRDYKKIAIAKDSDGKEFAMQFDPRAPLGFVFSRIGANHGGYFYTPQVHPARQSSENAPQSNASAATVSQQQQGLASSGNQTEITKPAEQGQQAQPAAPADTAAEWDQFVRTEGADVGTRRLGLIGQQRKDAADFAELARAEAADLGPRRLGIAIEQQRAKRTANTAVNTGTPPANTAVNTGTEGAPLQAPAARKGIAAGLFQTPPQPTTGGGPLPQVATDMPVGKYGIAAAVAQPKAKAATPFVAPPLTTREQPKTTSVLPQKAADMPVGRYGAAARRAEKQADAQKQQKPFVAPRFTAKDQPTTTSALPQQATEMPVGRFGVAAQTANDAERYARIKSTPPNQRSDEDIAFANAYFNKQQEPKVKAAADAEAARLSAENDTYGFAESAAPNPAIRQRIRNALNRLVSANGEIISRKALVMRAVNSGATVGQREGQRAILYPRGAYNTERQISKTAIDFAEFLLAMRNARSDENPSTINAIGDVAETAFGDIQKKQQPESKADGAASDTIQAPNGQPFKSQLAARRAASQQGVKDTHDVVPASEVSPGATGFVLRKKPEQKSPARLPPGWAEASPGGIATNKDERTGGIVDVSADGTWFAVANAEGIPTLAGFKSRDDAFAALAAAVERNVRASSPNASADISPDISPDTAASQQPKQTVRQRLLDHARRIGVYVDAGGSTRFFSGNGRVVVPAEDAQVEGAQSADHVFAHELGHATLQKRGLSFDRMPVSQLVRWMPEWKDVRNASKEFRPGVWNHANDRIRRHARTPNEIVADAIASVLLGINDVSLLRKIYAIEPHDAGFSVSSTKDISPDTAASQQPSAAQVQPDIGPDIAAAQQPQDQHIEGKSAEPATPAVIKEAVEKGADNSGLDLRKEYAVLLQQIDAAIAEAPPQSDLSKTPYVAIKVNKDRTDAVQNTKAHLVEYKDKITKALDGKVPPLFAKMLEDAIADAPDVAEPFVMFSVPGDGKFKVTNTKERLQLFRKKIVANASAFRPPPKKQPHKSPLQKKPQSGTADDATIREMLQDGELTAALELSKVVGRPLVFNANADRDGVPIVKTHSEPVVFKGFEELQFSVGRLLPMKKGDTGLWLVTNLQSGSSAGLVAKNRDEAISNAESRLDGSGAEAAKKNFYDALKSGRGASQADLEARWLKWAEEEEKRIDNADAIQARADKERADKKKSAVEKWKELTGIDVAGDPSRSLSADAAMAGYVAAAKRGNGDKFLAYVESAIAGDDGWQAGIIRSRIKILRAFRGDGWSYDMAGSDAGRQRFEFEATSEDGRKISAGISVEKDMASGFVREDGIIKAKVGIDDSLTVAEARKKADAVIAKLMRPYVRSDYREGDRVRYTPLSPSSLKPGVTEGVLASMETTSAGNTRLRIRTDEPAPQGGGNIVVVVYSQDGIVERVGASEQPNAAKGGERKIASAAAKPSPGRYVQPASSASREGQMALAQRGSRIASLLLMNEQVEKISPEKAYTDSEISNAATDRLDAMMDWLSKAATQRSAATPVVERENPPVSAVEPTSNAGELPAWHTKLPTQGLPIEPVATKSLADTRYQRVPSILAADAYKAITTNQMMAGGAFYAHYLPAADGRDGIVRLLPEDQKAPAPWKILSAQALRPHIQSQQDIERQVAEWLRSAPVIGDEKPGGTPTTGKAAGEPDAETRYNAAPDGPSISPSDRAIYEMANEGKSTDEILSFLSKASRRPFNRLLATALQKAGLQTTVTTDSQGGWQVGNRSYAQKYAAAYSPKSDKVALFTPRDAERHVLHELVHAATLRAIESGGVSAMRMRALFKHVQQSGKLDGQYGMSSLDEFVAEVFSNPKFRDALQGVPAPASSALKSVWQWFVRIVARIVGIKTQAAETALDRALRDGLALMEENAAIRAQVGGADRYATAWHGTPHVWAPEPGFPHGRPRLDKIGTGEGAQAYGWGWYSAESQGVASSYSTAPGAAFSVAGKTYAQLQNEWFDLPKPDRRAITALADSAGNASEALSNLEDQISPESKQAADLLRGWIADGKVKALKGTIYQLDIPDDVLPRLLDWDKPLSEQSPAVQEALRGSAIAPDESTWQHWTGQQLYEGEVRARTEFDGQAKGDARKLTSEQLASIGIPGLRYLDQGSRADGTGTYNYVIWDQPTLDRIALLERNGEKLDAIRAADEMRFSLDAGQPFDGPEVAATPLKPGATTLMVDGTERPALNSNGKPIHWSEEGIRNFWRWFSGSSVVDAQGRPLVVYHGTTRGGFTEFKANAASRSEGFVFTGNRSMALTYSGQDNSAEPGARSTKSGLYSTYLALRNQKVIDWGTEYFQKRDGASTNAAIAQAKAEGYDGLIIRNINDPGGYAELMQHRGKVPEGLDVIGDLYIAFHPEQIKSAIGNRGTFDATDPDIRYNLAADWQTAPTRAATTIRQYVADSMRSDSNTSWLTPFNTQYHKAEKWAAEGKVRFKEVFNIVQQFIADTSRFAVMSQNAAPALLHEIKSLRDVKSLLTSKDVLGKQHRADIEAIASPLYDGTLYGGGNPLAGLKWSDSLLRTKYNLTDRQIKLYHEALAAVKVSMDEMAKSLVAKHAKRLKVGFDNGMSLEDMVADVAEKMKELQDETQFAYLSDEAEQAVAASVEHYLEMDMKEEAKKTQATFKRQQKNAKEKIAEIEKTIADIKAIESKAVALQEHGYFPLMRFGRHTVTAKDAEGKTLFFGMYDGIPLVPRSGQAEANRVKREVQAMFPDATVETGIINDEKYKLYQGLNLDAMQIFAEHMDKDDLAPVQEFIRLATNSRSAMKRLMHREGTPGFDRDVRRTLAQFIVSNARSAASNYHNADMLRAAEEANKDGGDIGREAVRLVKYIQNPEEEAQVLRGFLFFQFLGGSIASAVVNLTQTPAMTLPFLSKFEPAGRLSRRLLSAAKMAVGDPKDIADAPLRDALMTAEMDGVTAPQEIHQLVATAANNLFAGSRTATVFLRGWGAPFAMAESVNRRIAFISAFKIAQGMGKDLKAKTGFATPFEFAEDAVNQTQGLYNKGNRMNVGRGAFGATVMTFKQFSIMYLELLKRLPPKQRAIMLGVLLISAGGGGLPGVEDAEDIWDTIGQWLGFASNSKRTIRNTLTDLTNPEIADLAINGLLSKMGIDLHSRLGMQNLLPGTAMLKQSSTDKGREITEVFGPAASVIKSVGDALEKLATGQPAGAAKALVPGAIRNIWQGVEMAATGRAEDARGRATVPVNEAESVAKVIGFNPKSVAQRGEVNRGLWQDQRLIEVKREGFTADIVSAILAGDDEAKTEAYDAMRAWNEDNPQHRVTINPATIGKRVREARAEGTARMVRALPKAMRQQAAEEFAR